MLPAREENFYPYTRHSQMYSSNVKVAFLAKNLDPCQNRKSSATSLEHQTPNRSILAVACRAPSSVSDAMQGLRPRAATGRFSVVSRAARPASRNRPRRNRPTMRKPCSALSACRGERTGAPHLSTSSAGASPTPTAAPRLEAESKFVFKNAFHVILPQPI